MGIWKYSAEFRADAVELVRSSGRAIARVAKELGVNHETLRHWVRSTERPEAAAETAKDAELARLRKENAELKPEREILLHGSRLFRAGDEQVSRFRFAEDHGDVTYLPVAGRWMYLATVLDIGSRRLLGYSLAEHMRAELVVDALNAAVRSRGSRVDGVIFHSNKGCPVHLGRVRGSL